MSTRYRPRERYVSANPGLHLIYWDYTNTKEQFLSHLIDGPIIGWELPPCFGPYPIPHTPQGRLDANFGVYAILSSDDGSVFWPENGRRYATLDAWLNDAKVNRLHASHQRQDEGNDESSFPPFDPEMRAGLQACGFTFDPEDKNLAGLIGDDRVLIRMSSFPSGGYLLVINGIDAALHFEARLLEIETYGKRSPVRLVPK